MIEQQLRDERRREAVGLAFAEAGAGIVLQARP